MELSDLEGVYMTTAVGLGGALSPLVIYDDGTVDVAGTIVPVNFVAPVLTILPCVVAGLNLQNTALTFKRTPDGTSLAFDGMLTVSGRPPTPYQGTNVFTYPNPTLQNAVEANAALDTGDAVQLVAANGYLVGEAGGVLTAKVYEAAGTYLATVTDRGVTFKRGSLYWVSNADGVLSVNGTPDQALVFQLKMTAAGKVLIQNVQDGRYVFVRIDGTLILASEGDLTTMMEFDVHITPVEPNVLLARWGVPALSAEFTACQLDIASLCWQCTGGLFLSLGLGPYMAGSTDRVKLGIMGILRTNATVWGKVQYAIDFLKANPKASASVIAGLATGVLKATWSAGLLWKIVKFALVQAGWWALFRLLAKIIETIFLPEVEVAELLASFIVWAASVVNTALKISTDCAGSLGLAVSSPRRWKTALAH